MWIIGAVKCLLRYSSRVCNLGLGVLLAKKYVYNDCPCIGHNVILVFVLFVHVRYPRVVHKWLESL